MIYKFDLDKETADWFEGFLKVLINVTYVRLANSFTVDCTKLNKHQIDVLENAFTFMGVM